ncbi:coatomer subunit epsilon [Frankliniella occidentalis]|uniref:Coatomer subunit epsilon n=1 Tax=Frankliniella occidentalis TaxID=133901 RepID=A0A6J1S0B5_FRAOC|nr:coatomer subunit epsilon [Frankliniella occidentalis]
MTPRQQGDVDELFDVKNSFFIGNYTQCIKEAENNDKVSTEELRFERLGFMYRAYIAQKKFRVVLDEVHSGSPPPLLPIRLLAEYFGSPQRRIELVQQLEQMLSSGVTGYKHLLILTAATIYCQEGNYEAALRVLHQGDHLEYNALNLHIYLRMDRKDLARKELKIMQERDDDATLTQLSQAWLNIALGGEKMLQDAYYIFQEMVDKYGSTSLLLNGQAACFMGQGKYQEAQSVLQEALDKDSNAPDTLINMTALSHYLGKAPEVANRYLSQLQDSHADNDFVKEYNQKTSEFQRLCKQYSVTSS